MPGFLDAPAAEFAAPLASSDLIRDVSTDVIGSYRVLHEIGRGGMGMVYLAERADQQFEKRVALKVLSRWTADERSVHRFVEERRILARLQHPDIAQLFDGGVMPGGLPWFAMEYVEGTPIDRYCDEHALELEDRLRLFLRVCGAVQYAHRNLVIHRDIKPANILVTKDGGVKLLDFGIAKMLVTEGEGTLTATGERLMTPMYASPEQIRGDMVSTSTDVYSLGILLCHLLTGSFPYRLTTREPHVVARAILEQEPLRPSELASPKLARRLRGDLDVIVWTAMQKDAAQRYGSVEQLAADVERYLAGLPLAARPQSALSRAGKFVKRHRIAVAAATTFVVVIVSFAVVAYLQAFRIRTQAARIADERDRAEQVSAFLAGLFRGSDPFGGTARGLSARELLDSGAARVDRELGGQPTTRAQMHLEMGRAYFGLGLTDRARRFVETSLAIRRRAPENEPRTLAETHRLLGEILLQQGHLAAAEGSYRNALLWQRRANPASALDMAKALDGLAGALRAGGHFRSADSISREAVGMNKAAGDTARLELAASLQGLAHSALELRDFTSAEANARQALAIHRDLLGGEHAQAARSEVLLAEILGEAGRTADADTFFLRAIDVQRRILGADHPDALRTRLAYAHFLRGARRWAEAQDLYARTLADARRRLPPVNLVTASVLLGIGQLSLDLDRPERAAAPLLEGLRMRRALLPHDHPQIALAEQLVGQALLRTGELVGTEMYLVRSHERLRAAYGARDERTRGALQRLVIFYENARQPQEAARYRDRLTAGRNEPAPMPMSDPRVAASEDTPTDVIVIPLRIGRENASLQDLRDWFQDLAATALGAPTDTARGSVTGFLVTGSIDRDGDRVSVEAQLSHRRTQVVRGRWQFSRNVDSLPQIADALAVAVLASLASEVQGDSAQLAATSLPALKAYLRGRRTSRTTQRQAAIRDYEDAFAVDSTFALAAMWLAVTEAMTGSAGANFGWRYEAAWRLRNRLHPAARGMLVAHLGPNYPAASSFVEHIHAAEELARVAPDWAESWVTLSEHIGRWGSLAGYERARARQRSFLQRAYALDSNYLLALDHLTVINATMGDTARVRHYAQAIAEKSRQDDFLFARWTAAIALEDTAALRQLRSQLSTAPQMALTRMAVWSDWQAHETEDGIRAAETLFRRAVGARERRTAANRLVPLLMNRGRPDSANRVLASFEQGFGPNQAVGGIREFQIYAYLYWDGDSSVAAQAAKRLEAFTAGAKLQPGEAGTPRTAICALAHWWLVSGQLSRARDAVQRNRRSPIRATATPTIESPVCMAGVEAQLAAFDNRAAAASALSTLESQLFANSNSRDHLLTIGFLIAARMHEALGNPRRALHFVRRRADWNVYLSTQVREEARLALIVGDTAGAIDAHSHYLGLRARPEARLAPEVEATRRVLARLEQRAR